MIDALTASTIVVAIVVAIVLGAAIVGIVTVASKRNARLRKDQEERHARDVEAYERGYSDRSK